MNGLVAVLIPIIAVWVMQRVDINPGKIPFEKGPERMEKYVSKNKRIVVARPNSEWGKALMRYGIEADNHGVVDSLIAFGYPLDNLIDFDTLETTPLLAAIHLGNEYAARSLIQAGAAPNLFSKGMPHPLVASIKADFEASTIEMLLESGADPNYCDDHFSTPLNMALPRTKFDIVDLLLKYGANIDLVDSSGMASLHYTVRYGESILTSYLFDKGADPNIQNKEGITPLFMAASIGDEYMLLELMDKGANINHQSKSGETALVIASLAGSFSCAYLLIENGADLLVEEDGGRTPLGAILSMPPKLHNENYHELLKILLGHELIDPVMELYNGLTPLQVFYYVYVEHIIAMREHEFDSALLSNYHRSIQTMMSYFIENSFDFTQATSTGWTILHKLSLASDPTVFSLILHEYEDVDPLTKFGSSPLLLAIEAGQIESVKLLLEAGADPNVIDSRGLSGMDLAILNGDELLEEIVENAGGLTTR